MRNNVGNHTRSGGSTRPIRGLSTLAFAAFAAFAVFSAATHAQVDAQVSPLQARSLAASCANCHGTNGAAAPGMVALAGYDKAGLAKAMADFKSGARPATIMHQLAKGYSEAQIDAMAGYFAAQKK